MPTASGQARWRGELGLPGSLVAQGGSQVEARRYSSRVPNTWMTIGSLLFLSSLIEQDGSKIEAE